MLIITDSSIFSAVLLPLQINWRLAPERWGILFQAVKMPFSLKKKYDYTVNFNEEEEKGGGEEGEGGRGG